MLNTIYLRYLNFSILNSDLFSGVPNLQKVMIIDSKIENIPKDIFNNNLKLNSIKFDNNKLKIIEFELLQEQKNNLKQFSFLNNPCINKAYKSDDSRSPSLNAVINEITQKCRESSVTPAPLEESPNEQRIQILEVKVEDFEEIRKNLVIQMEDGVKKMNGTLLMTSIKLELLSDQLKEFKKYVESNLTVEVSNVKTKYDKLTSDSRGISEKSEEMLKDLQKTLAIKSENQELRSKIDYNERLLIATFALQLVTVAFAVMITVYVKFFTNFGRKGGEVENIMYNGNN